MLHIRNSLFAVLIAGFTACGPGEIGPAGATGPQGPKGDTGASGIGLAKQTFCYGTGLFGEVGVTGYYTRYDFADGSAFVDCQVNANNGSAEVLFPLFYKNTNSEIANGDCTVNHDVDTANGVGFGRFEFRVPKGSLEGRMTYRDSVSGYDGTIVAISCPVSP